MNDLAQLQTLVQKRLKSDPAHDFGHVMRVYHNVNKIAKQEKVNLKLVLTAALLHDVISFPKSDKRAKTASTKSAREAKKILHSFNYTKQEIKIICDAIKDHSYSKNKTPSTLVGKILQDADRLDALGAIGIARTFVVGGAENRPIYNNSDPFCQKREPNDKSWTVDHFYKKLLLLEGKMNTSSAKTESHKRTKIMRKFLLELKKEITTESAIDI